MVITNFNYAPYVGEAVESALNQGPDVQVVVVDDGSTDDSPVVLAPYAEQVTLIRTANGGQGSAFNVGFGAATGDLVMLLDADDVLMAGAADRLLDAAAAHPDAAVFLHPLVVVDGRGQPTGATLPETGVALPSGDLRQRLLTNPDDIAWQPSSGLAFRSELLRSVLPVPAEDFRICADVYLMNTVALHGPVVALAEPGAAYRDHGGNAHLRASFDADRLRATIARTDRTHAELARRGIELGLLPTGTEPRFRSVTDHAGRLVINRLDGAAARTVWAEMRRGIEAAWRRPDRIGPTRRLVMTGWFLAATVAPRRLVPRLASLALTR